MRQLCGAPSAPPHAVFNEPVHLLDGLGEVMVCLEAQEMPWFKGGQPRGPGGFKEGRDALDQASSLADAGDWQGQPKLARGAAVHTGQQGCAGLLSLEDWGQGDVSQLWARQRPWGRARGK